MGGRVGGSIGRGRSSADMRRDAYAGDGRALDVAESGSLTLPLRCTREIALSGAACMETFDTVDGRGVVIYFE